MMTVWSVPNYCYRCGNVAAILKFNEVLDREFQIFREVPESEYTVVAKGNGGAGGGGGGGAYFM